MNILSVFAELLAQSGFAAITWQQCVIVMEAMKMETEIVAPAAGTVAAINVSTGDSVETGAVLVTLN